MQNEISLIPDRLNQEPIIFWGLSESDLKIVFVISAIWVPISLFLSFVSGFLVLGFPVGATLASLTFYVLGKRLTVLKRNNPRGHHKVIIDAWLEDRNLKRKTMIRCSKTWGIRRSNK